MSSVVLELQRDALDRKILITDLLRKSLVIARKLKINEFELWVTNELNGYDNIENIPEYRLTYGIVKAWNPFHGGQPLIFPDSVDSTIFTKRYNGQSIAELESLYEKDSSDSDLVMPFPTSIENQLRRAIQDDTQVTLFVPRTTIVKIIDAVRNIILNWAMKLEEDGIKGEGLSFSYQEKEVATKAEYNINNFYGPVQNSQIQQKTSSSIQTSQSIPLDLKSINKFLTDVREKYKELNLGEDEDQELESELTSIEAQVKSPKPKSPIIKEGLKSIRNILEGAGGGIASGLLSKLAEIIF